MGPGRAGHCRCLGWVPAKWTEAAVTMALSRQQAALMVSSYVLDRYSALHSLYSSACIRAGELGNGKAGRAISVARRRGLRQVRTHGEIPPCSDPSDPPHACAYDACRRRSSGGWMDAVRQGARPRRKVSVTSRSHGGFAVADGYLRPKI